jgi:hypothetical protein
VTSDRSSLEVSKIKVKIRKNVFLIFIFIFGTSRDCGAYS